MEYISVALFSIAVVIVAFVAILIGVKADDEWKYYKNKKIK